MGGAVTLLLGTTKGVFLLEGDDARRDWALRGPFCDGWPINHVVGEGGTGRLWAAGGNAFFGAGVWRSEDGGASWTLSLLANGQIDDFLAASPEFAAIFGGRPGGTAPFTGRIEALWSLHRAGGRLLAGAKPAALFASDDDGASWARIEGLSAHPSAEGWEPGGAGLTLHTIVSDPADPARLWVGISAAGVFASEDGGTTWERRNRRSNADAAGAHDHGAGAQGTGGHGGDGHGGDGHGDDGHGHGVGLCVHNFVRAPGDSAQAGDLLYQQNHQGVFRSADGGRSWQEITAGLPSGFGFPVAVHPRDPRTLWVLPLNGDTQGRYPPGASAAVWRSRDGGETWERTDRGLPQRDCYFTVLRQAMATDAGAPAGVYFGTNSGSVFASTDEGDSWAEIARHLPTVLSVEVLARG